VLLRRRVALKITKLGLFDKLALFLPRFRFLW